VEPARYMSKSQLTTALRRSFGNDVIASESSIGRLFDSFDFYRADQMDWRAFLYMLTMLMQPYYLFDVLNKLVECLLVFHLLNCHDGVLLVEKGLCEYDALRLVLILFFPSPLLRWAYAIYSSVGSLDLQCTDRLSLGMLKDMLCVPVLLSMRSDLRWVYLLACC
jgi:hypothetical protein